jgi:hypothetical protein
MAICRIWNLIFDHSSVKITDDNAKEPQVQKALNIRIMGFYWAYSNFLFFLGTVHVA